MFTSSKANPGFTLHDSGAWAQSESTIGWLSNDEIVFLGKGDMPGDYTISLWKIGKGVAVYKRHVKFLCFHYKYIAYITEDKSTGKIQGYYGEFGREKQHDYRQFHRMTCYSDEIHGGENRDIVPLLPEHGAIDRGPTRGPDALKNLPMALIQTKKERRRLELPLLRREVSGIFYYPFKNAYLVESNYFDPITNVGESPWPAKLARPLWWLSPEGKVTQLTVEPPWGRSEGLFPMAHGILISGFDERVARPKWPDDVGLFLLKEDGGVTKIMAGQIPRVAISPDGCSAVFIHIEKPASHDSSRLKMVSFCD